jgi:hypothetical protein
VIALADVARAGVACDCGDQDGIPDVLDKCTLDSRNATATCDTDSDGYGNPCDADFDQSLNVNAVDFGAFFIPAFKGGSTARGQDMDCNGLVSSIDFSQYFIPKFKGAPALGGPIPGPSGLACAGQPGCM